MGMLSGMKVLAKQDVPDTFLRIDFMDHKNYFLLQFSGGLLGKKEELYKDDIESIEIVDETQKSSDGAQRAKNAAIGVVLLGPIGLLGAAMGGAKKEFKLRVVFKNKMQFVVQVTGKECANIVKGIMGKTPEELQNEHLLKTA